MSPKHPCMHTASALLVFFAAPAFASTQFDYTWQVGIEHSDDINLSPIDPVSQNVLLPQFAFGLVQEGTDVQARASGLVQYRDYLGGAFENELRGNLSGLLNWHALPGRLDMTAEDFLSVQPVNVYASNAPSNQQQTNVFSVGPTLSFMLGPTVHGQAELRYINSTAQKTKDFNSDRATGALRAIKDLNATDKISGNIEMQSIRFTDDGAGPNYRLYNVYGRYQSQLSQLDIDAAMGWSQLDFSGNLPGQSGLFARGLVNWHATASSTFGLGASRQYSDATGDLMVDPRQVGAPVTSILTGNVVVNSQVYLERRFDASYAYAGPLLTARIAPFYRNLDYQNDPGQNLNGQGGTANIDYRLRPLWTLSFLLGGESRHYSAIDRRDRDLSYGLAFNDQLTQHWSWSVNLTRNQRRSNIALVGYSENVVFFNLAWQR